MAATLPWGPSEETPLSSPDERRNGDPDVVITDCDHRSVAEEVEMIRAAGFSVRVENCATAADVLRVASNAQVLITQYAPLDQTVMRGLKRCTGIVRYGVGVDNIDIDAAYAHDIVVANVPDYGIEEVASHAVMFVLALIRGLGPLQQSVSGGDWDYKVAVPLIRLSSLTVGVVGCGRIGSTVASMLHALGMRVIVTDPLVTEGHSDELGCELVELPTLLSTADVVTLHVPLANDTRALIDDTTISLMKHGSYLVNTARGGIVDSAALLRGLESGRIAGAALDVLDKEPPSGDDALVLHPKTIITPHAAWYSEEAYLALKRGVAEEAIRMLTREPVKNPIPSEQAGGADLRV